MRFLRALLCVMILAGAASAHHGYTHPYNDKWRSEREWVDCERLDIVIAAIDVVYEALAKKPFPNPDAASQMEILLDKKEYLLWLKQNVCKAC